MPTDVTMSKIHRKRVLVWLRKIALQQQGEITSIIPKIEDVRVNLNMMRARLVAEQIALEAIQRELAEWEEPKHEESNRDSSPL